MEKVLQQEDSWVEAERVPVSNEYIKRTFMNNLFYAFGWITHEQEDGMVLDTDIYIY